MADNSSPSFLPHSRKLGRSYLDWFVLAAGVAVSIFLVWLAAAQPLVIASFVGGAVLLGVFARALVPQVERQQQAQMLQPDWSVTVAAMDQPDHALAITDRAGRLVCANAHYDLWFGADYAPPGLPVNQTSSDRLMAAARSAWRDGHSFADGLEPIAPDAKALEKRWRADVHRAGRGEDYLIWRFSMAVAADPIAEIASHIQSKMGRTLAAAGFASVLVGPDGAIISASEEFAMRATGDAKSLLAGREFVTLLAQGDKDRLFWSRDEQHSLPITLYSVPLSDPDVMSAPQIDSTCLLMLVVDSGVGLGGDGLQVSAAPQLEALLTQLPLGLAMTDRDGRMLFANAAFMRAAGKENEIAPTYPTDLVVREDKAALSDAIRKFGQGPASAGDFAIRLAMQPDEPISLSLAGIRGMGEPAVLLSLSDSSEETRLKRQVAQATKMQAVGQLAGGVAHDFNNVLTAIIGTCDLMLLRHMPGDSDYDDIQQIRANSNRAASLTRQLLAFSRQQTLRPEVLQLPDVVSEISQMLRRLIGEKITLQVVHDRDLGPVRADPTQLGQVIVNLVVNARDAIQESAPRRGVEVGGMLKLSTRRISAADARSMRNEILPGTEYTALIVEDNGGGIPPENLAKIFEPFFTTKEQGKGTGLGLSTVYGIVKQSGGYIFADSEVGRGTRFSIYLPVHHASAAEVAAAHRPKEIAATWSGGGEILLVEDEDTVRMVAERALTRAGYKVTTGSDGDAGLEAVKERIALGRAMFDMVVSDVVMPGMDGPAMVRAIRELVPAMPVLFMSGHAEEQLRREIDIADAQFLPKPFSVQQISDRVAAVMAAGK